MLTLTFTTVIPTQIADMNTDIHNGGWIVVISGWIDAILGLKLREAFKKKYGIIWEFFSKMGGGRVFPIPKTQNPKKNPIKPP